MNRRSATRPCSARTASTSARARASASSTPRTGEIDVAELEDELDFEIESFNRRVITPGFNKVICEQLAQELDPFGEEKTMIFCVNQAHAERVKNLLDEAFKAGPRRAIQRGGRAEHHWAERQGRAADPPVQERALPEHRHHRRPAHHRHRRAAHLPSGVPAPGALAHPLRTDDRPRHAPLRRDRQDRVQHLRSGRYLRQRSKRWTP